MRANKYIRIFYILFALLLGVSGEAWADLTTSDIIIDGSIVHGSVTVTDVNATTRTVTLSVTPASGYYVNKSDIVVQKLVDPSTPNARRRVPDIANALPVDGDETTTGPASGTYSFVVPNDYAGALVSVTFTGMNPASATVTPNSLTYTGEAQPLVTLGAVVGGAATDPVTYSLTGASGSYTTTIPTGTDAGTYTVYYKVAGDATHSEGSGSVSVTIQKAALSEVTLAQSVQTYTGSLLTFTVSSVKAGTVNVPVGNYTVSGNTQTDVGNYTLTVIAVEDASHKNFTGTATASYRITPASTIIVNRNSSVSDPEGNYVLAEDVTASVFSGLASSTFKGTLDGDFHTIDMTGCNHALFNTISGGTVKNVMLKDVSISSGTNVGAIANEMTGTSSKIACIYNCGILPSENGSSISGSGNVGSLVGVLGQAGEGNEANCYARVINCFSYANITGGSSKGGIVGYNSYTSTSSDIRTMVMNCMFYGDIPNGGSPIYGGLIIDNNAANDGLNNFNYFSFDDFTGTISPYNCALGAEKRYLQRFEFHRYILNSNRELAALYATGNASDGAGIGSACKMAKWVLDKSIAPYPILKEQGYYPSVINYEDAPSLGTITISISQGTTNVPTGATVNSSKTLTIYDKSIENHHYNYRTIRLPYYCEVGGTKNYTSNKVVTGWDVTVSGGSANFADAADSKNFANRDANAYSRVFSQGAYLDIPEGASVSIKAHWANCVYLSDPTYDVTYNTSYAATNVTSMPRYTNGQSYSINGDNQVVYTTFKNAIDNLSAGSGTVYDHAIVLVGNYHQFCDASSLVNNSKLFTVMSADLNSDYEPDYSFFYQHTQRRNISPVRFDFLNFPGIGIGQKVNGTQNMAAQGIFRPRGWFEITNTCLVHFVQFEHDWTSKAANSPLILLGGVYDQFVSGNGGTGNDGPYDHTSYIHLGSNVYFEEFSNGVHGDASWATSRIPISVTGGEYKRFYLSGMFNPEAALYDDDKDAECYIDGGYFPEEVAGAGQEQIDGNVTWNIINADITNFYGGGINDAKSITGDITVNIKKSRIDLYCGGPKFGNMSSGKDVTTTADDCIFGKYFGAGYGGTSYYRHRTHNEYQKADYPWSTWAGEYERAYVAARHGISTSYEYEYVDRSGANNNQRVGRFYINYASLSLAETQDVNSTLTGCTIKSDFFGGGNLGKVNGDVESQLTNCTVFGSVFGAGYSATVPTVDVWPKHSDVPFVAPTYDGNAGVYVPGNYPDTETEGMVVYTWSDKGSTSSPFTDDSNGHWIYTNQDLTTLGQVLGNAKLTIDGNTYVKGIVHGTLDGNGVLSGDVTGGVFGGGDASDALGDTEVNINTTSLKSGYAYNTYNVFGGGNEANVGGSVVVNMIQGVVSHDVYGGGALANTNIGNATDYGTASEAISSTSTNTTTVNLMGGTVNGDVYGGGLGNATHAAIVYGDVQVNIGSGTVNPSTHFATAVDGAVTINSSVYGCNNLNGTPKGDVAVNVYKTAHDEKNTATYTQNDATYAISQVFGGGNKAAYAPVTVESPGTPHCATVHVYTCLNTVETVYGGGNAADATDVNLIIDGGRFYRVFGGGNGYSETGNHSQPDQPNYNPGANITGSATTQIHGGHYHQVFGGSNQFGDIASSSLLLDTESDCGELYIDESFGGANEAEITGNVETTLACSASSSSYHIGSFYGGSNLADITGNVTLNVEGGTYTNVFGGSKGRLAQAESGAEGQPGYQPAVAAKAANITGDVTLNLYGGTMDNSFGGSDVFGNIGGKITVNMLDKGGSCGLVVHNIYGGGRDAAYTPTTPGAYPEVNLIHGTVSKKAVTVEGNTTYIGGNVFGGGKGAGATVTSNPVVFVGYDASMATRLATLLPEITTLTNSTVSVAGNVYGGGDLASVSGSTSVTLQKHTAEGFTSSSTVSGDMYGGGNQADVTGTVTLLVSGGTVTQDVYGGGALANTNTVQVNTGTEQDPVMVYPSTTVTVTGGAVRNIYGGGLGDLASIGGGHTNVAALVNGAVAVTVNGGTVGDVFGCNNVNGAPQGTVTVTIEQTAATMAVTNVFGGGNLAAYSGSPIVYINNGTVSGNVYGGGNGDPADDTQAKGSTAAPIVTIGDLTAGHEDYVATVNGDVYGGGNAAKVTGSTAPTVLVQKCNSQVGYVYGGGNAADVPATYVSITGGTISHDVYGGGHGDKASLNVGEDTSHSDKAANVTGNVSVSVTGGTIDKVFAGSNLNGNIGGTVTLEINKAVDACDMKIGEVYGGGNQAAGNAGTITIGCTGTWTIDDDDNDGNNNFHNKHNNTNNRIGYELEGIGIVYGGANAADIGTSETPSNITLNITGGIVENAFGGNNTSGGINGSITVNVERGSAACDNYLGNVYGGGNLAAYSIYGYNTDGTVKTSGENPYDDPAVNIKNGTVSQNVYGGGKGASAVVTGNPVVTIGDLTPENSAYVATVTGDVYGGGDAAAVTGNTTVVFQKANNTAANLFGGGNQAGVSGTATINLQAGTVTAGVYGGCNTSGTTNVAVVNLIGGTVGTSGSVADIVFGGGLGHATTTTAATVHVGSDTSTGTSTIYSNVYGGSALGAVGIAIVNLNSATSVTGHVFGGGMGSGSAAETAATVTTSATVNQNGITLASGKDIYGGCNVNGTAAATTVNLLGGSVHDVFGGGLGQNTGVTGNVLVSVGAYNSDTDALSGTTTVSGNVYGGSAKGSVNTNTDNTTTVNLWAGTINGDVFGGGLGDLTSLGEGHSNIAAEVNGNVRVNLNGYDDSDNPVSKGTCVVKGSIYGCNNYNGSPEGTAEVHIYKTVEYTGHERTAAGNLSSTTPSDHSYELLAVYGGGNQAAFTGITTNVVIETCDPSIETVYGGGNAADATNTRVEVKGAYEIGTVFGGGNGQVTAANVSGTATSVLNGGLIHDFYGGSNSQGTIGTYNSGTSTSTGGTVITINDLSISSGEGCGLRFDNIYGAGKNANVDGSVSMTMGCLSDAFTIQNLYGGAQAANIKGGVTLTVTSGRFDRVFGGNNESGTIGGNIIVNLEETGCKPLIIGQVFGGGNQADHGHNTTVNAKSFTSIGEIYGGGSLANVEGTASVNIQTTASTLNSSDASIFAGDTKTIGGRSVVLPAHAKDAVGAIGYVYGGGLGDGSHAASVTGAVTVTVTSGTAENVFGCNNVNGTPQSTVNVNINGGTITNVYGGGNLAAYTGNSGPAISMIGGTVGYVYGGGLGSTAVVNGNTSVSISGGTVNYDVYGGGSEADVTQNVTVSISGGRVLNDVYGGGALANTNTDNWNSESSTETYYVVSGIEAGTSLSGLGLYYKPYIYTQVGGLGTTAQTGITYFSESSGVYTPVPASDIEVGTTDVSSYYTRSLGDITSASGLAEEDVLYYRKVTGDWASGKTSASNTTTINLTGGIIGHSLQNPSSSTLVPSDYLGGNVYGGGLGRLASTGVEAKEAMVYGDITVNLGDEDPSVGATAFVQRFITPPAETDPKISNADVPFSGRVFGCNNLNGSPKGDVTVTVWKTIQMDGETPMSGHSENKFDVHSVYGGGNLASYQPADGKTTKVRIHGCENTSIEKVFGGGNSAYVPSTDVIIYGCYYVGYAFGGGNGADRVWKNGDWYLNDGAPVYGDASIIAVGGKIGQVFSGSDTKGTIYGNATIKLKGKDDASLGGLTGECDLKITNAYGAGRGADIENNVIMIVSGCIGNNSIERVFGGSYDANIRGDIKLTITSGIYTQVFGGNDHGGTVGGNIYVDIEESDNCNPTIIMYLYGGGREAAYPGVGAKNLAGADVDHGKITINVKSATRIDNIFGGNFRATLKGDTEVNINMIKGDWVGKSINFPDNYRGDKIPNVSESSERYDEVTSELKVEDLVNDIEASPLTGLYTREELDTDPVTYKYTKIEDQLAVYEGTGRYWKMTMVEGTIYDAIGTIGNVYGGSYMSTTTGNTTVNIGTAKSTTILNRATAGGQPLAKDGLSVYDAQGKLRDNIELDYNTKNVLGAHITGNVYGGGYMADVTGNATVNICAAGNPATTVDFRNGITWASGESYEGVKILGTIYGGGYQGSIGEYNTDANGKPSSLKTGAGGKTYVNVMGDAQIGPDNMVMPTFTGHVFGGSQGYVADPTSDTNVENTAFANNTYVTIGDRAFVKGSVYGGSENGHVLHDTYVYIQDNCQIGNGYVQMQDDGTYLATQGGVNRRYTDAEWAAGHLITTGETALTTLVDGNYTSSLPECASWKYGQAAVAANKYVPYDKYNYGGGNSTGDDGHTFYGNVFGGGSGYFPYASGKWLRTAGRVEGNTHVIITGGHILTSIYGGNEMTDVLGNTHVVMTGGSLGVPRTLWQTVAHPVTCYLFGAGKGDQRTDFNQWTNVKNAYVHVSDDARVYGSVFGGGEDGHVYGDAITGIGSSTLFGYETLPSAISSNVVLSALTPTGSKTVGSIQYPYIGTWGTSYVDGNIFGGGRGYSGEALTAGAVCGNTQVNIKGGTMLGSIYGGGRLAGVGIRLLPDSDPNYGELIADTEDPYSTGSTTHGHTTINISGGTIGNNIEYMYEPASGDRTNMPKTVFDDSNRLMHTKGGNVFAGSMGRREGQDGSTAMTNWRKLGIVKSTKLNISGTAWIKGNVFGGGEFGAVTGSHKIGELDAGTEINISGGTIGTMLEKDKAPSAVDASYTGTGDNRYTFGSVYGGGYGTEAEAILTTDDVEKFGAFVNNNTYVKMTGGKVRASVYGGGEMACVKGNTHVDVSAGEIGIGELRVTAGPKKDYVLFGGWRMGNVYGGGKGSTNAVYSGLVAGNTNVNISGGGIYHNVYGGGALSSVGTYTLATSAAPPIQVGTPTACSAGGTATVTITGGTIGINGWDNGMVNGSGRGDISTNKPTGANPYDEYDNLGWVNNSVVTIGTSGQGFDTPQPQIKGTVYGGGENGHNFGDASVTVHSGTIGHTDPTLTHERGNVFGSGCGTDTYDESTDAVKYFNPMGGRVRGNTTVTIDGGHILRSAYGGGSMASVDGSCSITVSGGRIGTDGSVYGCVYGGPKGNLKADHAAHVGSTTVNINYATTPTADDGSTTQLITNSVFGGGEAGIVYGDVVVNMNGGLVLKDVYGGGALANTNTSNWNASTSTWATSPSAMYSPTTGTTHKSIVSLKGGTVQHNVYGGGLGRLEVFTAAEAATYNTANSLTSGSPGYKYGGDAKPSSIAAKVYGDVLVKLNETTATDNCVVKGNIFGCNNLYGSPQSSVTVHVYKTQGWPGHDVSTGKEEAEANPEDLTMKTNTVYELAAVYGGGDLAMYRPDLKSVADTAKTYVIIDGCQLTSIQKVYGGGNAASVPATSVRVNGTYEIGELFGGGNGKDKISYDGVNEIDNPGANVGYINYSTLSGTTWTDNSDADTKEKRMKEPAISKYHYGLGSTEIVVTGGKIHACYGGSDTKGNVRSSVTSSYEDAGECAPMSIDETYGGGKDAPMDADITVDLKCAEDMAEIFGGSKNADLNSNVNLTITNGTYGKVFGGNNTSGAINGSITVTVEEKGCKPIIIGELYGGGYLAPYSVYGYQKTGDTYNTESVPYIDTDGTTKNLDQRIPLTSGTAQLDPRINIISATYIGTIYGGGYQAKVVGSPHINVNMERGKVLAKYANNNDGTIKDAFTVDTHTDAHGDKYVVDSHVAGEDAFLAIGTIGTVFGGGNMADVVGNTYVDIGTGSWVKREKSGGVITEITETLSRKAATITNNVYGGGKMGNVGNVTSTDANGKPTAFASGTGICTVTINNGTIGPDNMTMYHLDGSGNVPATDKPDDHGHVFGGGQGTLDYYYDDYSKTEAEKIAGMLALGSTGTTDEEKAALMDAAMNAKLGKLAFVDSTEVKIGGTAFVQGCVFGGAENGHVLHNTGVKISGGQIGNGHILLTDTDGTILVNKGLNRPYRDAEWTAGNLSLEVGDLTGVSDANRALITSKFSTSLPECAAWPYGQEISEGKLVAGAHHAPYDKFANHSSEGDIGKYANGASTEGGHRVASSGRTFNGNVFGGGSGYYPYAPGHWLETAGEVEGNTWVVVTGGHILTSLYGGNEMSTVKGDTHVGMSGGTLGVPRTLDEIDAHPVTCYVFGGGKGEGRKFLDGGVNVQNANVAISGGWVYGSVFGGAEDGHVLEDANVTISGTAKIGTWGTSYVDGNVFGGGRGYDGHNLQAGNVVGNTNITITGGTMLGSIYGGGRLGSVGTYLTTEGNNHYGAYMPDVVTTAATYYTSSDVLPDGVEVGDEKTATVLSEAHGYTTINISGGVIGNDLEFVTVPDDVTPAGLAAWQEAHFIPKTEYETKTVDATTYIHRLRHTKGGNVFGGSMGRLTKLDGTINEIWPRIGQAKATQVNISGTALIKGSVYGGSEFGTVNQTAKVSITGGTVNHDVFGGGFGSADYTNPRDIYVKEETTPGNYETKTYTFTPMQFAGCVGVGTLVDISGGWVKKSVYGGGKLASVGVPDVANATRHDTKDQIGTPYERSLDFGLSWPYDIPMKEGFDGLSRVKVTGTARIGLTGKDYMGQVDASGNAVDANGTLLSADQEKNFEQDNGDIFGGGMGVPGDRYNYAYSANVNNSRIFINLDATATPATYKNTSTSCVAGSVYAGSENGHVLADAKVTLVNGLIGHALYGGGKGKDTYKGTLSQIQYDGCTLPSTYDTDVFGFTSGKVYGNTYVTMTGGHVLRNVYGGGNMASMGKGNFAGGPDDYFTLGYGEYVTSLWTSSSTGDLAWQFLNSGKAEVNVLGGTVGYINETNPSKTVKDGLPYGNVFGGARGEPVPNINVLPPYKYTPVSYSGYVNETKVTIGKAGETGPTILGSVYGGGQDGHVRRDAYVIVNSGEIGVPYNPSGVIGPPYTTTNCNLGSLKVTDSGTGEEVDNDQWLHRGNVFGSGSGISKYKFDFNRDGDYEDAFTYQGTPVKETDYCTSAGSVTRFSQVDINGGTIHRNVYGGGSRASVGPPPNPMTPGVDPYKKGDTADGHTAGKQSQNTVIVTGTVGTPTNYNEVYGGEVYGASRGDSESGDTYSTSVWTKVHIKNGAVIKGNVFGGGDAGKVKKDTDVIIGD